MVRSHPDTGNLSLVAYIRTGTIFRFRYFTTSTGH